MDSFHSCSALNSRNRSIIRNGGAAPFGGNDRVLRISQSAIARRNQRRNRFVWKCYLLEMLFTFL